MSLICQVSTLDINLFYAGIQALQRLYPKIHPYAPPRTGQKCVVGGWPGGGGG